MLVWDKLIKEALILVVHRRRVCRDTRLLKLGVHAFKVEVLVGHCYAAATTVTGCSFSIRETVLIVVGLCIARGMDRVVGAR